MDSSIKPYREERPWGSFTKYTQNENSTVKIIVVNTGEAFSRQFHHKRDEFWHIISGDGLIEIGDKKENIVPGKDYNIPHETPHRVTAGNLPVVFLEISEGDFDESDIVRLEDRYGRTQ